MPLHAGWRDYCAYISAGFKNVFSYNYVVDQKQRQDRQACSVALKEAAEHIKDARNQCPVFKKARKDSNDVLVKEIKNPGISNFFIKSKPFFSTIGILNTSEAAFLLNELREKKKEMLKTLGADDIKEVSGKSEKPRRITDTRELPELGRCEYNNSMTKYFLSFVANLTPAGRSFLRVSLIERSAGVKKMQNRETGEIQDVPCTKKLLKVMFAGNENENNEFEWKRIDNDGNQSVEEQPCQEALERKAKRKKPTSVEFNLEKNEIQKFTRWNYANKADTKL
jgi:hypothetical protein